MNSSPQIKTELVKLFGEEAYKEGELNRPFISSIVFNNKKQLEKLNFIVHPVVAKDFIDWKNSQKSDFAIKEAAILFESGAYKACDLNVNISANIEERISRVVKRDSINKELVLQRINNQWSDEKREKYSDYTLINDNIEDLENNVLELVNFLKRQKEA